MILGRRSAVVVVVVAAASVAALAGSARAQGQREAGFLTIATAAASSTPSARMVGLGNMAPPHRGAERYFREVGPIR